MKNQYLLRFPLLFVIVLLSISAGQAQLYINEWMASNTTAISDEAAEFDDWLEIYNAGDEAVNLKNYYISDDLADPLQYQFPEDLWVAAESYLLLWADKSPEQGPAHVDFKLSSAGEDLVLSSPDESIVHSISFGPQIEDISQGSFPDGNEASYFFTSSTPGASNQDTGTPAGLEAPNFNHPGGYFSNSTSISITAPNPAAAIYYTLDGSTPDENSQLYTSPVAITETKVLRAISFINEFPKSEITSGVYFIDETHSLPTISIIAEPDDFFGDQGIYANPFESGNEWERFCQIQYFNEGVEAFQIDAGIRIQGSSSVGLPKKSFRLFFESQYGEKWLKYPLFADNEVQQFRNLVLRSGYDDDISGSNGTLLRDPFCSEQFKKSDGFVSDSEWCILTINGEYWGIYEIRESVNDHFIDSHKNWPEFDMIRFTKFGPEVKEGNIDDWQALTDFIENNDFSDPNAYAQLTEMIDIDEFINLLALINNTAYSSWTWGVSAFKEKKTGAKWHFTIWDMDRNLFDNNWDAFEKYDDPDGIYWANFIPQAMVQNTSFSHALINRTADLLNSDYTPENSLEELTTIKNQILSEIPNEYTRWNDNEDVDDWEDNLDKIIQFLENRPDHVRDQIVDYFSLSGTNQLDLDITGEGHILLNSLSLHNFPWSGTYLEEVAIDLHAIPDPGYYFAGWSDGSLPDDAKIQITFDDTKNLTAIFNAGNTEQHDIVINEINYHSPDTADAGDWLELYNATNNEVDLSGWYLQDESGAYFSLPQHTILAADGYLVIAEDLMRFSSQYPTINNVIGQFGDQGDISFGLSNSGELINIKNANASFIDPVDYQDTSPWSTAADGDGPSLQLIATDLDNAMAVHWSALPPTPGQPNNAENSKDEQIIEFDPIPGHFALDAPFTISASSNSGLPVTLEIISGPAQLTDNLLTLDGIAGTVVLRASQLGNEEYLPAESVDRSFQIFKEEQFLEFVPVADQLPTASPITIEASSSAGLPVQLELLSGPGNLQGNVVTLSGELGTIVLEASQTGNDTYTPATEITINIKVDKLDQFINIDEIADQLTTAPDFSIFANVDSGLPLELKVVDGPAFITGTLLSLEQTAGKVTVRARQVGDDNHHLTEAFTSFDVLLTPQSIDFPIIPNQLNTNPDFSISASSNSGLPVLFEVISGPASIIDNVISLSGDLGDVVVRATQAGDATFEAAPAAERSFQVTQVPLLDQSINFPALNDKYTFDDPFAISASASSGLAVNFTITAGPATIVDNTVSLMGEPGLVTIAAEQLGDTEYNPAQTVSQSFTVIEVIPDNQVISFSPIADQLTDAAPITLDAQASSQLPVSFTLISGPADLLDDVLTLTGVPGTVVVSANQAGDNFFLAAPEVQISFEVKLVDAIDELSEAAQLSLYPNPANGILNIQLQKFTPGGYTLINCLGQFIMTGELRSNGNGIHQIDLTNLPSGHYIIRLENQSGHALIRQFILDQR